MPKRILGICLVLSALAGCAPKADQVPLPRLESGGVYWTYQTGSAIWGTPTAGDGRVYVGSDDNNLYALDAASGELLWKFTTGDKVRSTPAVSKGIVYFCSDDGSLYAVRTKDGSLAWQVDIHNVAERELFDQNARVFDYLQSSPVVADGVLYVGSADGNLYALDARRGKLRWTYQTGAMLRATPTVDSGTVYVGNWAGDLYALDAGRGELRWKAFIAFPVSPVYLYRPIQSRALVVSGTVYDASRKASVVALDALTGELQWEYDYGMGLWVESSPVLVGDTIYIGSSGNQSVYVLDSRTGELLSRTPSRTFNLGTPLIVGDVIYVGGIVFYAEGTGSPDLRDRSGLIAYRISDRSTLTEIWRMAIPTTLDPGGAWSGLASSPVVAGGVIYFGALDGQVYAVQP
jgi:outer membrane protein assembly factor BamB